MKFELIVRHKGGTETWSEPYDRPNLQTLDDACRWARETIDLFNFSLRPSERERELVELKEIQQAKGASSTHTWQKTSLVTQIFHGQLFDAMRCSVCGITGRRYGISGAVMRNAQYRSGGFAFCGRSIELLKKRKEKERARHSEARP